MNNNDNYQTIKSETTALNSTIIDRERRKLVKWWVRCSTMITLDHTNIWLKQTICFGLKPSALLFLLSWHCSIRLISVRLIFVFSLKYWLYHNKLPLLIMYEVLFVVNSLNYTVTAQLKLVYLFMDIFILTLCTIIAFICQLIPKRMV